MRHPSVGEPVFGTSWVRHGDRRRRAARIARALRPAAHVLGGLASTELIVPYRGRWYRPDAAVLIDDDPPPDGVLDRAPMLVVRLGGPLTGAEWLRAGADAVWMCDDEVVEQLTRQGRQRLERDEWLAHPDEPALRLAAAALVAAPSADARISA